MAVDEHLFSELGSKPGTTVRFYSWERPTASLGYSQNVAKVLDLASCRGYGVDVVRRITGGKLVLHWREVTYSVVSSDIEVFSETLAESYRLISLGLIRGLRKMGLQAQLAGSPTASYSKGNMPCFAHPARDEIEIDGRKIVGSAQKRAAGGFLQHGSIPLQDDEGLLSRISLARDQGEPLRRTSISEVLGREVHWRWAVDYLVKGMAEYFGVSFEPLTLNAEDEERIRCIQSRRYENEDWTMRGFGAPSIDFPGFG